MNCPAWNVCQTELTTSVIVTSSNGDKQHPIAMRTPSQWVLMALSFVAPSSAADPYVVRYIATVIEYLAATETGAMSCVFYGMTYGGTFEQVFSSPWLGMVTKLVVTSDVKPEVIARLPTDHLLIVVETNQILSSYRKLLTVLLAFDPSSKVLLLARMSTNDCTISVRVVRHL